MRRRKPAGFSVRIEEHDEKVQQEETERTEERKSLLCFLCSLLFHILL
jgi:hypothetical protein